MRPFDSDDEWLLALETDWYQTQVRELWIDRFLNIVWCKVKRINHG